MPNARNAQEVTTHKILVLGDTGSGKTSQVLTLPGKTFAYLFDPNAILSLKGHDIDYEEFLPDRLNLSIKPLAASKTGDKTSNFSNEEYVRWEKDFQGKVTSKFFDQYDNIVFDSATTFLDLIMDRQLTLNGRPGSWPQQDDYGPQMLAFTSTCRTLMALNKTIYMTGHLEVKKDELQQRIFRSPMMTGRLRTKIPLLFSDIFVCEVDNDGRGNIKHRIMTAPDRITTTVRTAFKGLKPYEDVTIDWTKSPVGQGIGGLILAERVKK